MSEKTPAKVDYLKPLEGLPYRDVVAGRERHAEDMLRAVQVIVGPDSVSIRPEVLERYSRDLSLEPAGRPTMVVRPQDTQQLCALAAYANERNIPLVPASSGVHNYGATIPRMGGFVVDLSDWRTIHTVDRRNRAVRIAPGVTYGQLQPVLEQEGLRALIPLLPRREQSVLTAHLEGQPMLVPEFNYSEPIYTAEIVLPGGELFRTGTAAVAPPEQNRSDMIGPWGPGIDWNRLYTRAQGTLGVVTWMNIMAEPLPQKQRLYFTAFDSIEDGVEFTYRVQRKWIGYECFILDRTSLAWMLAEEDGDIMGLRSRLPRYVQVFCIGGLKRFPDERIAWQEADFMAVSQECGCTPRSTLAGAPRAESFFQLHLRRSWAGDVYWKDRRRGGCAEIFFIITMDRAGDCIRAMHQEAAAADYSLQDIGIYLQPIENGRAAHLEFMLPFSPADANEQQRVRALHESASRHMHRLGAVFTRAYGHWGQMVTGGNAVQHQTAGKIKEVIDPNTIMNPGRLGL
jgi:FAD/FMN-containing dehydrogenase